MKSKSPIFAGLSPTTTRPIRIASFAFACGILFASLTTGNYCSADENSIRKYLADGETTSYLQQGDFRIERIEPRQHVPDGAMVFQKFIRNIPLHGSRVVVVEEFDGFVSEVYDDSTAHLNLNAAAVAMDSHLAEMLVESSTKHAISSNSELVWFRLGDEAILAWEVTTDLADTGQPVSPTGLETVVDIATGDILSQRQIDTNLYIPGQTEVFPRIVINNAIGAAGSRAYAAPFDAVVEVAFGCTGTLIAENVVLCARHCGVGSGATIIFGDNSNGGGIFSATVQSSFLPDGNGSLLDGGDVSILTLTSNIPSNIATPMRLIDETNALEGMLCATIGYGFNGLGSVGHGNSADGFRWGGENIIDVYGSPAAAGGSNIISTDFDNGSGANNTIGGSSPTPVEFEATTAPGDSGGPVLVQIGSEWVIAGVLSGGTTGNSVYGDISWWTGTAIYRSDIEARGGEFAGNIEITLPNGTPDFIASGGGDFMDVEIIPSETENIVPGSGRLNVIDGGLQQTSLITNSATSFTAVFPPTECMNIVGFYISFDLQSGGTITLPANAPSETFSVLSAIDVTNLFADSFDTGMGWSVTGDATDGMWQRAVPNNGDRGDPAQDAEASGAGFCFVTDNGNIPDDNTDVDGGSTTLTSPNMVGVGGGLGGTAFLSYYRWYSNDFGGSPNADTFVVEISNNGGATWQNLETIGPSGPGTSGGWIFVEHQIDTIIAPTANMRVRFTASDFGDGSVVEAGVDAVTVRLVECESEVLHGDVNLDGVINLLDVQPFVDLISSGGFQAEADVNKDGVVNLLDVGPFIELLGG